MFSFSCFDKIVANISNYFSINIGDLIFTGTPAGVGECMVGDELEAFLCELRDNSAVAHYIKELEEHAVSPAPIGITGFSIARD